MNALDSVIDQMIEMKLNEIITQPSKKADLIDLIITMQEFLTKKNIKILTPCKEVLFSIHTNDLISHIKNIAKTIFDKYII